MEEFSREFMHGLDPDASRRLQEQNIKDDLNEMFTPDTRSEYGTESTILGNITLETIIARSENSVLFSIVEHPNLLIKYQVQCDALGKEIHPLLRDAWYGQVANGIGVAPRVVWVSPGAHLCRSKTGKCDFIMNSETFAKCTRSIGTVRYMIVEKNPGMTLNSLRKSEFGSRTGSLGFKNSLIIGINLIELLERLHNMGGIIHGDIHQHNLMLTENHAPGSVPYYIEFIDFGLSKSIANITLPEEPVYTQSYWYHRSCTPWQIDGYAWSRRDDVMKALYVTFQLMHPERYSEYVQTLARRGYRSLMRWKTLERIYVTPTDDPIYHLRLSIERKRRVYELLDRLLVVARGMRINEAPPYRELISLMEEALRVGDHKIE
jgi:serine/threonine protein kinase